MDNQINNFGFNDLNLKEDLLKGVYLYGFTKPSKIQINGIQNISSGKDCMLQSQSGTGKTATYLLGVLNRIDSNENKCQGIIITPTHELADQVYSVAIELSKFLGINIVKCIGGTDLNDNRDKISKSDVFDKEGNFVEGGKELLRRKATGYISFVRGDNPYTFPFKIWPYDFAPDKTNYDSNKSAIWQSNTAYQGQFIYPSIDYNNQQINDIKYLSLYLVTAEKYQSDVYTITLNNILSKNPEYQMKLHFEEL